MVVREIPSHRRRIVTLPRILIGLAALIIFCASTIAHYAIEYEWWKEMGQLGTWTNSLIYGTVPWLAVAVVVFLVLWIAHARALKFTGTGLRNYSLYALASTVALGFLALLIASAGMDSWTVVRFVGARAAAADPGMWHDPVFNRPLSFYFFDLPFYSELVRLVMLISFFAAVIYWIAARGWQLRSQIPDFRSGAFELDIRDLGLRESKRAHLFRFFVALFLVAAAVKFYLGRYEMLLDEHRFLVGIDYVADKIGLPLQWAMVFTCVAAAGLVMASQPRIAVALGALVTVLRIAIPLAVAGLYVKPNEISLEKPYIQQHIEATRAAYGLHLRLKEVQFPARLESKIDPSRNKPLLENVRLWDWRAFQATITQLQALRPYYVFPDTDVDRYVIDGQLRQVMLTPRELDVRQLADARSNWINTHFIYTHGYGAVMAEANRITPSGAPVLFIQDAPPKIETNSLKLTRPELYYGEKTHEPVFVRTSQPEFNYPAGADNVHSMYTGNAGVPITSFLTRFAAALKYGDWNILLTSYLTPESRMLIRRDVRERLMTLASFIEWDSDPYLVITNDGRMVWIVDGYTTSDQHPYSRQLSSGTSLNYIRNSVKATVDAYDGHVSLYVFDPNDPIIRAWQAIFPTLFRPAAEMPADLRAHARYPETLFRAQSEIYRTYHMRDPESFYNKEDLWDVAKNVYGQETKPVAVEPTFVVATLPGETNPEFLLILPFVPRSKDNLIGVMMARCDGEHLGEIVVLQLSKQNLIYGPLQIEARIDSDQNISKDLTLWNQQGSSVVRGQMLTLPIEDTFLYVEPIYIQSAQARMPQMKKVVLAMGNTIIYRDTYDQALADLGVTVPAAAMTREVTAAPGAAPGGTPTTPPAASTSPTGGSGSQATVEQVRDHLRRYREFAAQGKWADAGKELEAIEGLVKR